MSHDSPVLPFMMTTLGAGLLVGALTAPTTDLWYEHLAKPSFTPPDWVFPPVWTVLYLMIGWAGGLVWARDKHSAAMKLWFLQLFLNLFWPFVFFLAERTDIALLVVLTLLVALGGFIATGRARSPLAAVLFVPYGLWVAYATVLNAAIFLMN
jgi:tryptophan-rich sensory protein